MTVEGQACNKYSFLEVLIISGIAIEHATFLVEPEKGNYLDGKYKF